MPGLVSSDITNFLNEEMPQIMADAVGRKSMLFGMFPHKFVTGGPGPRWNVTYAGNSSVQSFGDGDAPLAAGKQSRLPASLDWKRIRGTIQIERSAIEMANGDFSQIGDLFQSELDGLYQDFADELDDQLMSDGTGNSSKDITGIQAVNADSGSYAGIDPSTYTWWKAYVDAAVGTLAEVDLKTAMRDLTNTPRKANPSFMLMGPAVWDICAALFETTRNQTILQTDFGKGGLKLQAGATALEYQGIPLIRVPGYTAQRIDILDMVSDGGWRIDIIRNFLVDELPLNGDAQVWQVSFGAQLRCHNRRKQGTLTGITA